MSSQYPIVKSEIGSGPVETDDLREQLRKGILSRSVLICFEPWTNGETLPADQIPQLADDINTELALMAHRIRNKRIPYASLMLLFVLCVMMWLQGNNPDIQHQMEHWWMLGWGSTTLDGHWYSPLLSQFVHSSMSHFLVNIVVIAYCSYRVEQALGWLSILQIVLLSTGVGGVLVCSFSVFPVVGSSIMGFGLWGAQIALGFRYVDGIPKSHQKYYGWGTFLIFLPIYSYGLHNMQVSHLGHLGGLVGGVWVAMVGSHGLKPGMQWAEFRRWVAYVSLFLLPSMSIWPSIAETEVVLFSEQGIEIVVPKRVVRQSSDGLELLSAHPNDDAFLFLERWVLTTPSDDTIDASKAWWEQKFEAPVQLVSLETSEIHRRIQFLVGDYEAVEIQWLRGLWVNRIGYWVHKSSVNRKLWLENWLNSAELNEPESLSEAREQFELISVLPDVRFEFARALAELGEGNASDEVISELVDVDSGWGPKAVYFRFWLRSIYPKSFDYSQDLSWMTLYLNKYGTLHPSLFYPAFNIVLHMEDCKTAGELLNLIDDGNTRSEIQEQTSMYCLLEEE